MEPAERMRELVGRWSGSEELTETAWTAAGVARGEFVIEPGPDGIVLDYRETGADGTVTGHGVVAEGGWWWFDSYGYVPRTAGTARWVDDRLVLERSSERARNIMTLESVDGRLAMTLAAATPPDAAPQVLVTGVYDRTSSGLDETRTEK